MSASPHITILRISRAGWCGLALVLLAPWIILLWLVTATNTREGAAATKKDSAAPGKTPLVATASRPGVPAALVSPAGELLTSRILIEPPEEFVPAYFTKVQPLIWTFKGYSSAQLDALWQEAGVVQAIRQQLQDPKARNVTGDAIVLHPSTEAVLALSPESRARIYAALAVFPENAIQRDPFRCRADAVDDWFDDQVLPPSIVALTKKLLYRRGNAVLFTDHDLVLPLLTDAADRVQFIKTLSRKSALLVELHVPHNADVEGLARYWGRGRRSKDVKPLLESLAQRPNGGTIDISHLLPAFARLLLYTYPTPSDRPIDGARDCHWTSLNFFRETPDDRLLKLEFVQQTLLNDYYEVGDQPAMGDIVMLVERGGHGVHSCVYIADNIVFTKNGSAFSVPWLLAPLDGVVAFYSLTEPLEVRRYRAKSN